MIPCVFPLFSSLYNSGAVEEIKRKKREREHVEICFTVEGMRENGVQEDSRNRLGGVGGFWRGKNCWYVGSQRPKPGAMQRFPVGGF